MKSQLSLILLSGLLSACASGPVSTATQPNDIYINSTADIENCKYLGVVESQSQENWKGDFRKQGGDAGATHIVSSGPNGVTGSHEGETITGNMYFCKK